MNQHVHKGWSGLLLCLALCSFGTAASAEGVSIRKLGLDQLRLASIAYRLGDANAGQCARPDMMTGLVLHDLTQYEKALRPSVATAFSLHEGVGVLQIVPGSVGQQAGFQIDDEILAVGGASLADPSAIALAAQSASRIERASAQIAEALRGGAQDFTVRRHGRLLTIRLAGDPGCGGTPYLISSSQLNAWSDGRRIFVSSAMMRLAGDDDSLAFVLAHEMAHNMLGHSSHAANRGLLGLFGFGAARIRGEERDADRAAISLVARGGYRPMAAVEILAALQRILWWNLSLDHPGFAARIRTVLATAECAPAGRDVAALASAPPTLPRRQ